MIPTSIRLTSLNNFVAKMTTEPTDRPPICEFDMVEQLVSVSSHPTYITTPRGSFQLLSDIWRRS